MAKIICDYCKFGTIDKLCYKGGMKACHGELFVCKQNIATGERQLTIPEVIGMLPSREEVENYKNGYSNNRMARIDWLNGYIWLLERLGGNYR